MKKWSRILVGLGVLSLILGASAWSPPVGTGSGGVGRGQGRQYDPNNLVTVSGEVTKVTKSMRRAKGLHLEVKTAKETLLVFLGPASYLEQQKMTLAVGDKVEIKGTRVQRPQQAILIAGELKKGNQVVKLRDENGMPLWSRQGPGKR